MKELFQALDAYAGNSVKQILTVLQGEYITQKALAVNGKLVWMCDPDGFFEKYKDRIFDTNAGGTINIDGTDVFCESPESENTLVICGGGHVSMPVITIGTMLGFRVTVLEDRPEYAANARKAGANRVLCDAFEKSLKTIEGGPNTYFVIVTRGHRYDTECLEQIIQKEHAYIGMIGSKKRTALVKEQLVEKGYDRAVLDSVYTPIGLKIGAETPQEIAVSILAELVQVKNAQNRTGGYSRELRKALQDPQTDQVLATIVSRKGSAPREVGTKMLIGRDGHCTGSIGGGCMEAEVIKRAVFMLKRGNTPAQICHVDMTGADAEKEGMVCGGKVDVFLEVIPKAAAGAPAKKYA